MINQKAQKLTQKIIDDLKHNGIIVNTLVEDLKALRPYAIQEKKPVVAKALRLISEHVEAHETFAIPIPLDDEIYDEDSGEFIEIEESDDNYKSKESLLYLMNLIRKSGNHQNKEEIREYNESLKVYAEEN